MGCVTQNIASQLAWVIGMTCIALNTSCDLTAKCLKATLDAKKVYYDETSGSCFGHIEKFRTWKDAMEYCGSKADSSAGEVGRLAWITSESQYSRVQSGLTNLQDVWIGMKKRDQYGNRQSNFWYSDTSTPGLPIDWCTDKMTNFEFKYTDNDKECMMIKKFSDNKVHEKDCADGLEFICELTCDRSHSAQYLAVDCGDYCNTVGAFRQGTSCYVPHDQDNVAQLNVVDASNACSDFGSYSGLSGVEGRLAQFADIDVYEAVKAEYNLKHEFWIGMQDMGGNDNFIEHFWKSGSCESADPGGIVSSTFADRTNFGDTSKTCIVVNTTEANFVKDKACTDKKGYICELACARTCDVPTTTTTTTSTTTIPTTTTSTTTIQTPTTSTTTIPPTTTPVTTIPTTTTSATTTLTATTPTTNIPTTITPTTTTLTTTTPTTTRLTTTTPTTTTLTTTTPTTSIPTTITPTTNIPTTITPTTTTLTTTTPTTTTLTTTTPTTNVPTTITPTTTTLTTTTPTTSIPTTITPTTNIPTTITPTTTTLTTTTPTTTTLTTTTPTTNVPTTITPTTTTLTTTTPTTARLTTTTPTTTIFTMTDISTTMKTTEPLSTTAVSSTTEKSSTTLVASTDPPTTTTSSSTETSSTTSSTVPSSTTTYMATGPSSTSTVISTDPSSTTTVSSTEPSATSTVISTEPSSTTTVSSTEPSAISTVISTDPSSTTTVSSTEPSATSTVMSTEPSSTTTVSSTEPSATSTVVSTEPSSTTTVSSTKPLATTTASSAPATLSPTGATCPVLLIENGKLKNMHSFNMHGHSKWVVCNAGYQPVGSSTTCNNGQWSIIPGCKNNLSWRCPAGVPTVYTGAACYWLSSASMTWEASFSGCSSFGGRLAPISSSDLWDERLYDFVNTSGESKIWFNMKYQAANAPRQFTNPTTSILAAPYFPHYESVVDISAGCKSINMISHTVDHETCSSVYRALCYRPTAYAQFQFVKDKRLVEGGNQTKLGELIVPSFRKCLAECRRVDNCLAVNYLTNLMKCQFYSQKYYDNPSAVVAAPQAEEVRIGVRMY